MRCAARAGSARGLQFVTGHRLADSFAETLAKTSQIAGRVLKYSVDLQVERELVDCLPHQDSGFPKSHRVPRLPHDVRVTARHVRNAERGTLQRGHDVVRYPACSVHVLEPVAVDFLVWHCAFGAIPHGLEYGVELIAERHHHEALQARHGHVTPPSCLALLVPFPTLSNRRADCPPTCPTRNSAANVTRCTCPAHSWRRGDQRAPPA